MAVWADLGVVAAGSGWPSDPVVGINGDGRMEVFMRGRDGALYHRWQTSPNNGWSGSWDPLGGQWAGNPAVGRNQDGRLELVARGLDQQLYRRAQTAANNGWSPAWDTLGGTATADPVLAVDEDGRLALFVRHADGGIYHLAQQRPNGGWARHWIGLGGAAAGNPVVGRQGDGTLVVFIRGTDGQIRAQAQRTPNGDWPGTWTTFAGAVATDPSVGGNQDGRLELFVGGLDGRVYHQWQAAPHGGWSGVWVRLNDVFQFAGPVAVARNADGTLSVFRRSQTGALQQLSQIGANNGWAAGWSSLGGQWPGAAVVAANADGRLEIFMHGQDGHLYHTWQTTPSGAWWNIAPNAAWPASIYPDVHKNWRNPCPMPIPGTHTNAAGASMIELRGWLREGSTQPNGADDPPDWTYHLEVDPKWIDQAGIDFNQLMRVGSILSHCIVSDHFAAVSLPMVKIELMSWHPGQHYNDRSISDPNWGFLDDTLGMHWRWNPALSSSPVAKRLLFSGDTRQYVRIIGSLVSDDPHWNDGDDYSRASRGWGDSVTSYGPNPKLNAINPARWAEIHPPDLIDVLADDQPQTETVRCVAVYSHNGLWSGESKSFDADFFPPPTSTPATLGFIELIGGDTNPTTVKEKRIDVLTDHIHVHVRVEGEGGWGRPGKFKAIYRTFWRL